MTQQAEQIKKWANYLPAILLILLIMGISKTLAELTWQWLDRESNWASPVTLSAGQTSSDSNRKAVEKTKQADIASWNLFGKVEPKTKAVEPTPTPVKAPDTKLRLELKGVYVADDKAQSSAIVADKGKSERYLVGDKMPGGVSLHEVFEDKVLLARGGRLETLRFSEKSLKSSSRSKSRSSSSRRATRNKNSGSLLNQIRSGKIRSASEAVEKANNSGPGMLTSMINEIGLEDMEQSGEGTGFRVGASAPRDVLSAVGLRKGDIVHSVNGQLLGDIQNDPNIMQEILASGSAKIEIQRGKRRFVVTYPLP